MMNQASAARSMIESGIAPCCLAGRRRTTPYATRKRTQEIDMPQTITQGFRAMLDEAEREIETLTVEEARKLHGRPDVTFVDLRDPREREREGKMPGAFHCPRGMLEFWIDPASPYHKPAFAEE